MVHCLNRRGVMRLGVGFVGSTALSAAPFTAAAQVDFPSDPIDVIVPFGVGGGTDIWQRAFATALSRDAALGVPVNVRNIPGASSLRGTGEGVMASPDGYTLTAFNPPSTPWSWYLNQPPFEITEFAGVSVYVREPGLVVVNPNAGIESMDGLLAAYESGDQSVIASLQVGSIWHVAALLMQRRSNVAWERYVSYQGTADVLAAVMRGEVDVAIVTASSAVDAVRDGSVTPLGVIGLTERIDAYSDVPTLNEAGLDPLEVCVLRRAVFAPAGIDDAVRSRLEEAYIAAQDSDALAQLYESLGLPPARGDGEEAMQALRNSIAVAEEIGLRDIAK